jgi:quercetin dioxygenase-like cupin family protein
MSELFDLSTREKVNVLERHMREMPQIEIPVRHYFSQGLYAREISIPAGALITGKIHKYPQLNILSKGEMLLISDGEVQRVQAPMTVCSPPGTKRAAYAVSDCVWTTIHATDETDVEKIEAHFIAKDETEYLEFSQLRLER